MKESVDALELDLRPLQDRLDKCFLAMAFSVLFAQVSWRGVASRKGKRYFFKLEIFYSFER